MKLFFKPIHYYLYQFVQCYELSKNEQPHSAGIFVFAQENKDGNHAVLGIQLLLSEDGIGATLQRMKEDSAMYIFWKECADELRCDAEIDDIKHGEDYRMKME